MATTDPITGLSTNNQADFATGGLQIGALLQGLRTMVVPRFASATARDAAYTAAAVTLVDGMRCTVAGLPMTRINGRWEYEALRPAWTARTARAGSTDAYAPGSFVNLILGTWVGAPAGIYRVDAALSIAAAVAAAGTARLTVGGTILAEPRCDAGATTPLPYSFPEQLYWGGGDLTYRLDHNAGGSNNITVFNPNTKMILTFEGATP